MFIYVFVQFYFCLKTIRTIKVGRTFAVLFTTTRKRRQKQPKQIFETKRKWIFLLSEESSPFFLLNLAKSPFLNEKRLFTSKQVKKFRMKNSSEGRWCIDLAQKIGYLPIRSAWWRSKAVVSSTNPKHNWGQFFFCRETGKVA